MRSVIYARVSTEEQGQGYSLPTQIAGCRRYAAEQGHTVLGEFVEQYTGTERERPALHALMEFVRAQKVEVVIVFDVDRLARRKVHQVLIEEDLLQRGARVEFALGQYKDTAEGQLLKGIRQEIAEYENHQRVERSRRGKEGRPRQEGGQEGRGTRRRRRRRGG